MAQSCNCQIAVTKKLIDLCQGKTLVEKKRLNILVVCSGKSFNSFNIFVGRLLGPTDLLSFNDHIKSMISSEVVGFRKKEF